jgi:hypothetical protein
MTKKTKSSSELAAMTPAHSPAKITVSTSKMKQSTSSPVTMVPCLKQDKYAGKMNVLPVDLVNHTSLYFTTRLPKSLEDSLAHHYWDLSK